jgi:hypothetical protein
LGARLIPTAAGRQNTNREQLLNLAEKVTGPAQPSGPRAQTTSLAPAFAKVYWFKVKRSLDNFQVVIFWPDFHSLWPSW